MDIHDQRDGVAVPFTKRRVLQILWPAFMAAGVLEMLVFALIDPAELQWFDGPPIAWSRQAVYSVTFVVFWAAIATASAVTALLSIKRDELNALGTESP